ncbi:MAG: hypothetical protein RL189_3145 [Pseudomonadota bacterium]|jgi:ABC-type proline/glycine betaine transport system ATPase subunit
MKHSELLWIQNMARLACGQTVQVQQPTEILNQALGFFLEELTAILHGHVTYFNDLVMQERPDLAVRVFKLGVPRTGLMLLRGKEKLIVQNDGFRLRVRIVQIQAYQEQSIEAFDVDAVLNADNTVSWIASHDRQRINPLLLVQEYLGKFMGYGAQSFLRPRATGQRSATGSSAELQP